MTDSAYIDVHALRSDDSLPVQGTTPDMIDLDRVARHLTGAIERGRYRGPTDVWEYLRRKKCIAMHDGVECATLAGLLCFGHDPQAIFPRAVIDIGHYRGTQTLSYEVTHLEKDIGGTIFDQLARVESYLWDNIHHGMTLSESSFKRVEVHEYPRAVIRELGVNMVAHRDYKNFRSAGRVQLFRNRIEWISPGGLPPGITVENILAEQAPRNPVIMTILYEAGYVEAFGQGLDTVVAVLQQEGHPPPKFEDTGASFIVTVLGRAMDIFPVDGVYARLSENQRRLLSIIRTHEALSPRQITEIIGNRARRSIQRDLRVLVEADLIQAIGEGRALRYCLKTEEDGE